MQSKNQIKFRELMKIIYAFIPILEPGEFLQDFFNYVVDKNNPTIPILQSSYDTLNRLLDSHPLSSYDAKTMININNNKVKEYLTNHINEDRLMELGSAIGLNKYKTIDDIAVRLSSELANLLRSISTQKKEPKKNTMLDISVDVNSFSNTFYFKKRDNLYSTKNKTISIYTLEFDAPSFKFKQEDMFKLLLDNIISYVNSKIFNNKLKESGKMDYSALQKIIREEYKNQSNSSQLSEMLLYIFLEASLNAPKLMSKIQLNETDQTSYSDGIHIHKLPTINSEPQFDIVFGSSCIVNDITNAIDNAFEKILKIEKNSTKEITLLSEECLDCYIDEGINIKEILLPHDNESTTRPLRGTNAFGIFIGYTFNLDYSKSNLIDTFKKQYENDFVVAKTHIEKKIEQLNLNKYSFYIYLLPLNNIDETKADLMNKFILGD